MTDNPTGVVIIYHYFGFVKNNCAHKIDLVFAGHAHGGQIRLPGIGGLLASNQGWFPKKTSGTFTEDRTTMGVSRGIGNSLFPSRVNNRPELVIVTLKTA
ncbi:MAG: hypothetical protein KIG16_02410 [Eubacteriales bacterium]|nr:hypothetical protein [Eubacteriales bacterium]